MKDSKAKWSNQSSVQIDVFCCNDLSATLCLSLTWCSLWLVVLWTRKLLNVDTPVNVMPLSQTSSQLF